MERWGCMRANVQCEVHRSNKWRTTSLQGWQCDGEDRGSMSRMPSSPWPLSRSFCQDSWSCCWSNQDWIQPVSLITNYVTCIFHCNKCTQLLINAWFQCNLNYLSTPFVFLFAGFELWSPRLSMITVYSTCSSCWANCKGSLLKLKSYWQKKAHANSCNTIWQKKKTILIILTIWINKLFLSELFCKINGPSF